MELLLLSIDPAPIDAFLTECVAAPRAGQRLGYISDAAAGMPFAAAERTSIAALGCELVDIEVGRLSADAWAALLDTLDAVYVASGETFALLAALRAHHTGDVLAQRVRDGLPYIGCSAGSIVAGPTITPLELMDDRQAGVGLTSDDGLGLIDQVIVPHADGRIPPYPAELIERILSTYGDTYPLLPLRDDQALRVSGAHSRVIPTTA